MCVILFMGIFVDCCMMDRYMKKFIIGVFTVGVALFSFVAEAQTYTRADSLKVVELLCEGKAQPKGTNLPLYFAGKLKGMPYVAATLEVNPTEQLVVNLRQLDCTTLVENVVALTLTVREARPTFKAFCRNLERIRYRNGKCDGYASRNHYFSQWIESNERQEIVTEVKGRVSEGYKPFVSRQTLDLNYMSTHPDLYPMLKGKPEELRLIRKSETASSGRTVRYIPRSWLDKTDRSCVKDGDILAIVTKKKGLDTSHLGFAVWRNGRLHLLNASMIHKKVVLEPMTLSEYMAKHPTQMGIRVVRIN